MSNDLINRIQEAQKKFFNNGHTKPIANRIEALKLLRNIIEKNEESIFEALRLDLNKSKTEAYTSEIAYILTDIDIAIKKLKQWSKTEKVRTSLINMPGRSLIVKEPFGIALIIAPWNYPFNLLFGPMVSAIAAGNCVIAKPSEIASASAKLIHKLISENFPEEYIAVVEGDADITQKLINQNTDYIFFTGSTAIGKKIMESAAKHLIPVTLELGGKNPCIIDEDTDLDVTARRVIWGKFFNAGQTCVAPDYLLVHKNIQSAFIAKLKETVQQFYGNDDSLQTNFTHIINVKQFERLTGLLSEGTIIYGGETNIDNLFISPTIITNIDFSHKIMQEEIFGPILPILTFDNLDSLIAKINTFAKPLSLYYFSSNKENQHKIINNTSSGSVCINGTIHTLISHALPFGGVGDSGMGAYHGQSGFDTFSHSKSVLIKSFLADSKLIYPPYKTSLELLKKLYKYIT